MKIDLKTMFANYNFKVNLKSYLSITVLRLIFKTVVSECGFIKQKKKKFNFANILKKKPIYVIEYFEKKFIYVIFFFLKMSYFYIKLSFFS